MKAQPSPLGPAFVRKIDAYWRAANYLSVGQIYLHDNPLLKKPLTRAHIKPRLLGHRGTTPGLNFVYVHLNRVIKEHDLKVPEVDAQTIGRVRRGYRMAFTIYVAATLIALVAPWWALALNVAVRVHLLRMRYQPVPLVAR